MLTILVTGDRGWLDKGAIRRELLHWGPDAVIHGAARGADSMAAETCWDLDISTFPFHADWEKYGRAAGPIRNKEMLGFLLHTVGHKLVLAFHSDLEKSKGTKDMVRRALKAGLPVRLIC